MVAILGNPRYNGRQVWNRQRTGPARIISELRVLASRWPERKESRTLQEAPGLCRSCALMRALSSSPSRERAFW